MNEQLDALAEVDPELALNLVGLLATARAEAFAEAATYVAEYTALYDDEGPEDLLAILSENLLAKSEEEVAPFLDTESV